MQKTKFASDKQSILVLFYSRNAIMQKVTKNAFTLPERKRLTNLQKCNFKKTFHPVCMLLVQLTSMNSFIFCDNWKTLFLINVFSYS